jgi:hypothetical protein
VNEIERLQHLVEVRPRKRHLLALSPAAGDTIGS